MHSIFPQSGYFQASVVVIMTVQHIHCLHFSTNFLKYTQCSLLYYDDRIVMIHVASLKDELKDENSHCSPSESKISTFLIFTIALYNERREKDFISNLHNSNKNNNNNYYFLKTVYEEPHFRKANLFINLLQK